MTASAEEGPKAELLKEYGLRLVGREAGNRQRMFEATMHGLAGWRTRHVGCLWNKETVVVELHEHIAHEEWADVLELADNCSRFDTEVTVRQEPFDRGMAIREWQTSLERSTEGGRKAYYDLYARKNAGNTLYIGSGASRYKARLYDKGRQSRLPVYQDCWRYEVQARRERAVQVAERLGASGDPRADMAGLVYEHFAARGVVPIFGAVSTATLPALPRPPTDAERSLAWIETAWRPTLKRLAEWDAEKDAWRVMGFRYDPRTGEKI